MQICTENSLSFLCASLSWNPVLSHEGLLFQVSITLLFVIISRVHSLFAMPSERAHKKISLFFFAKMVLGSVGAMCMSQSERAKTTRKKYKIKKSLAKEENTPSLDSKLIINYNNEMEHGIACLKTLLSLVRLQFLSFLLSVSSRCFFPYSLFRIVRVNCMHCAVESFNSAAWKFLLNSLSFLSWWWFETLQLA